MRPDRRRSRLSVRSRLTLIATAASALAIVLGAVVLYGNVTSALDSGLTDELRVRALDVADEVRHGIPPSLSSGFETQVLSADGSTMQPAGEDPLLDPSEISIAATDQLVLDRTDEDQEVRVVALAATGPMPSPPVVVAVAAGTASITRTSERLVVQMLVAGVVLVGATAAAAWLLSGAALKPVHSMSRKARGLSTSDPDGRLPVPPGHDAVAELGVTLNEMLGRIGEARTRERAFIDDASHEMRAPLAVIRGELELALLEHRDAGGPDSTERSLLSALDETDRLGRLTDHLLVLARADAGMLDAERERLSLREVLEGCVARLALPHTTVEIVGADLEVTTNRVDLEQVVTNLLVNAVRWARTSVRCEVGLRPPDAVLRVSDDGPGFSEDYLAHAFHRFRRGDPARPRAGSSTGLGLAIAAAIVEAHGGQARLGNDSDLGGAWVEVALPTDPPDRTDLPGPS